MKENIENRSIEIDNIIIFIDQEFLWRNIIEKIFFDIKEKDQVWKWSREIWIEF